MRTLSLSLLVAAHVVLAGCSTEESVAPERSASASSATSSPSATANAKVRISAHHGGSLVAVGTHHVELLLFKRGHAEAWVLDARGVPMKPTASMKLALKQQGEAAQSLALSWSTPLARFAADANAALAPVETTVELSIDGKMETGKLTAPVLLVGPSLGGTLVAAGQYGVELVVNADGLIEARVSAADGATLAGGIQLAVNADAAGGKMQHIALEWDAELGRFRGHAKAGVQLAAGPLVIFINDKLAGRIPRIGLRAAASHGGRLVAVGTYSVELVADGALVSAFVADASAAAHVAGDLDLSVMIGGKLVKLAWDAPSASYQAKLDAELDLDVQPIEVAIRAGGRVSVGALAGANAELDAALGTPKLDAKAGVDAKAGAKVGVKAPSVKIPSVKAGADAKAGSGKGKAGAKAGFSIGTK